MDSKADQVYPECSEKDEFIIEPPEVDISDKTPIWHTGVYY